MIVTGDIETILVRDLKPFGIPTYKKDAILEGEVTDGCADRGWWCRRFCF